jgi:hypothetical protein
MRTTDAREDGEPQVNRGVGAVALTLPSACDNLAQNQ